MASIMVKSLIQNRGFSSMKRPKKSWGFPRWGGYGQDRDAVKVRTCDFEGCLSLGDRPAPKSPLSPEKWWFCVDHAAEYNRNWNFFEGMSAEEAKRYAEQDRSTGEDYKKSDVYGWGGVVDADGFTKTERDAIRVLGLETDASEKQIKAQYRALAKRFHPDHNQGDTEAEKQFQKVCMAFDVLKAKAAR